MNRPWLHLYIVGGLVILLASPAWAGFQAGLDSYDRGDYDTALKEFRPLADEGNAGAQYNLGYMYMKGQGLSQDYGEAAKWYRLAAEQGLANAQLTLGVWYLTGTGVQKDSQEAIRWLRLAGEQGDAKAQQALGILYSGEGLGLFGSVPKDLQESLRWFRLAAEQGDAGIQSRLGGTYYYGKDVPRDFHEAARWYRLAAEQGDADAQYRLGFMYARGEGLPKDYVLAYMWMNLVAGQELLEKDWEAAKKDMLRAMEVVKEKLAKGKKSEGVWGEFLKASEKFGKPVRKNVEEYRDALEGVMTREQIAEAQRLTREKMLQIAEAQRLARERLAAQERETLIRDLPESDPISPSSP